MSRTGRGAVRWWSSALALYPQCARRGAPKTSASFSWKAWWGQDLHRWGPFHFRGSYENFSKVCLPVFLMQIGVMARVESFCAICLLHTRRVKPFTAFTSEISYLSSLWSLGLECLTTFKYNCWNFLSSAQVMHTCVTSASNMDSANQMSKDRGRANGII